MRMKTLFWAFFTATLGGNAVQPAEGAFHLMQIEQVIGGVNGDTTAQAVQLRMRSLGQNILASTRMRAWDAAGQNPIVVVNFTQSVGSGAGRRILIASPG